MAASRHLQPQQFGEAHSWLESDAGHNWMDAKFMMNSMYKNHVPANLYDLKDDSDDNWEMGPDAYNSAKNEKYRTPGRGPAGFERHGRARRAIRARGGF